MIHRWNEIRISETTKYSILLYSTCINSYYPHGFPMETLSVGAWNPIPCMASLFFPWDRQDQLSQMITLILALIFACSRQSSLCHALVESHSTFHVAECSHGSFDLPHRFDYRPLDYSEVESNHDNFDVPHHSFDLSHQPDYQLENLVHHTIGKIHIATIKANMWVYYERTSIYVWSMNKFSASVKKIETCLLYLATTFGTIVE